MTHSEIDHSMEFDHFLIRSHSFSHFNSRFFFNLRVFIKEGWGAVDGGSVNAFLAAALARVMRVAVPIPAVASASVFHSAGGGGSVVDVVRPL